jgi:hypothetical protein
MLARMAATNKPTTRERAKKPVIASSIQSQTDIVPPVSAPAKHLQIA